VTIHFLELLAIVVHLLSALSVTILVCLGLADSGKVLLVNYISTRERVILASLLWRRKAPPGNTGHAHGQRAASCAARFGSLRPFLPGIGSEADTLAVECLAVPDQM